MTKMCCNNKSLLQPLLSPKSVYPIYLILKQCTKLLLPCLAENCALIEENTNFINESNLFNHLKSRGTRRY